MMARGDTSNVVGFPGLLRSVAQRHPEFAERLRVLLGRSERIRELCSDLEDVERSIRYWSTSDDACAAARCAEFQRIRDELDDEIVAVITEEKAGD